MRKSKCNILKTACLNVSALTTSTKQNAIRKWVKDEEIDIAGLSETCFKEGNEPSQWIKRYKTYFNSVSNTSYDTLTDHGRHAYKWGVAITIRDSIKICDVIRPQGTLNGRVIMAAVFMEAKDPRVLWVIVIYAPVRTTEHDTFFREMEEAWKGYVKNKDQVIIMGDLNAHLTGSALERSSPSVTYEKESKYFQSFVMKHGLLDARSLLGAMNISRDFTYTHHDGTLARLDYQLISAIECALTFQTVDFNRIATNHRAIIMETDLFRLTGGWKTKMTTHSYPVPINVVNATPEQLATFARKEEEWITKLNKKLYVALVNNKPETDSLIVCKQNTFIKELTRLCVKSARKVWCNNQNYVHKRSKAKGILTGKITWLRRAYKSAKELTNTTGKDNSDTRRKKSLMNRIKTSKWFPKLAAPVWSTLSTANKLKWMAKVKRVLIEHTLRLKEVESKEREERKDLLHAFFRKEGAANSGRFRRWRLRLNSDPDGEVVKDKKGNIITSEEEIRKRYGEYYGDLFHGEEERHTHLIHSDRTIWMDPGVMNNNRMKLQEATKGVSVVESPLTLDEYMQIIREGDPVSSGGPDQIQYGILTKLSMGTHLAILGLLGTWWRTRSLPDTLRLVEICSLHKRGDRMDLVNKRGIGLVCKLVLIMETVLLNRISKALEKAGTRSLAQGGTHKDVHTGDVIVTLVNVIHNAKRTNKPLHLVEFDLFKFFDRIPHRGFADAHTFFGFDEDTIKMASLFWTNFVGIARSRFGHSDPFPISIGNIQGLAGSPNRSGLFLDMMLCLLECENFGYRFATNNYYFNKKHVIDDSATNIYAVAWIDDITLMEQDFGRLERAVERYNSFINYYGLRFVPEKCKHYSINDAASDHKTLSFTDFNGVKSDIKKVGTTEAFRCLGVFLNMNADWSAHADHITGKLDSFNTRIGKHWSPAWLTSKVINSNAIPAITYGLSVANLKDREIAKLQTALIQQVKKDGGHSKFVPKKAYTMPIENGGYNVASISAIYKATKIGGVYHYLNSTFPFANITTRATLWDLTRAQGSLLTPLNGNAKINKEVLKANFPDYLIAATETLREIGVGIYPRECWDLSRISILTFARCIAGWETKSTVITILHKEGIKYMHQLCTWFRNDATWYELTTEKIPLITIIAAKKGLNKVCELPTDDPLNVPEAVKSFNSSRRVLLRNVIRQGIYNIATCQHALSFVPLTLKNSGEWKKLRFKSFGTPSSLKARWFSDGSRIGDHASFAIVDQNDNLIAKTNISGRSSSQRAELKGLEMAMFLGPHTDKVLDPFFIIRTVSRARRNEIAAYEWSKIDNRSIVKSVSFLAKDSECNIVWVKGHQKSNITEDGMHNICADAHARLLTDKPLAAFIDEAWEHTDDFFFTLNGNLFEGDVRRAMYELFISNEHESLKAGNERFAHESWWMESPTHTETIKYSTLRFKIFTKTLPTHNRLRKSFPGLYDRLKCPGCEELG